MSYTTSSGSLPGRPRFFAVVVTVLAACAWMAAPTGASVDTPTGYNPKGLPTAGCFWTGPFTADNPKTNAAYPGTEITYWGAKFVTPPGSVLTLKGRFPHARYSSFNTYESDGASASSLSDRQIRPDRGSINPSRPGRNRSAKNRRFTVRALGQAPPVKPARNTLYAEPKPGFSQDILYRVYIPDRGRGRAGGTGLPRPSLRLADGTTLTGQALCDSMNSNHDYAGSLMPLSTYQSLVGTPGKDPASNPALARFEFFKYFNLPNLFARFQTEDRWHQAWESNPAEEGTQYNNNDARYMIGPYSFRFGEVLAVRGRMLSTPRTLGGSKRTGAGQMVEWDMCTIQSLVTTKTYRCLFDQQVPIRNRRRDYVVLVSLAGNRPANATRKCGVAWLAADPEGDGAGRTDAGQLLNRNILPSPGFRRSIWDVTTPFNAEQTMGPYYPKGTYMDKVEFESRGCPFRWK